MSEQEVPGRHAGRAADGRRHADRAAQFMPFAALTGYYDLIRSVAERQARDESAPEGQDAWPGAAALAGNRPGRRRP